MGTVLSDPPTGTFHATWSSATVAASIGELVVARVLSRSWPGIAQSSAAGGAEGVVVVVVVVAFVVVVAAPVAVAGSDPRLAAATSAASAS